MHTEENMRPRHYCGLFGIYGHPNAAELTYYGLYALQHRGQESAGIAASDEERLIARETFEVPLSRKVPLAELHCKRAGDAADDVVPRFVETGEERPGDQIRHDADPPLRLHQFVDVFWRICFAARSRR